MHGWKSGKSTFRNWTNVPTIEQLFAPADFSANVTSEYVEFVGVASIQSAVSSDQMTRED